MRIGIDARSLRVKGGAQKYTYGLISALLKIDSDNEYYLFYDTQDFIDIKAKNLINIAIKPFFKKKCLTEILRRSYWTQIKLPKVLKRYKIDVLHSPKFELPYFCPCKSVVTVLDLVFKVFPESLCFSDRLWWKMFAFLAAKSASSIISISESTKNDLINFYHADKNRVTVTYLATPTNYAPVNELSKIMEIKAKYKLITPFVLYTGTIQPRKNLDSLVNAFNNLKINGLKHKLVIVGKRGWKYRSLFDLINKLNLKKEIIFTDYAAEKDLPYLYSLADLFVYPSFYEGFGLPVLEAMACGVPIITSATSSLPEVTGKSAILIDPKNINDLASAISKVLNNADLREKMITRGLEQAKRFSWEKCAKKTLNIYKSVHNEKNSYKSKS